MRCIKTTLWGFLFILACVVCSGGCRAGVDFIKTIVSAVDEFGKFLFSLALQFPDELGITDWLWTRGIYTVIAIAATLLTGYAFTRKEQKKLVGIIGSVVGLVSMILTFA